MAILNFFFFFANQERKEMPSSMVTHSLDQMTKVCSCMVICIDYCPFTSVLECKGLELTSHMHALITQLCECVSQLSCGKVMQCLVAYTSGTFMQLCQLHSMYSCSQLTTGTTQHSQTPCMPARTGCSAIHQYVSDTILRIFHGP